MFRQSRSLLRTTAALASNPAAFQRCRAPILSAAFSTASPGVALNKEATHDLFFVEDVDHIETGPKTKQTVPAFELTNSVGMKVKAMRQGACVVDISKNDNKYLWDNVEGACYYGKGEDAFPLDRGLILHGGIRYAAVTAEHGLYYDTEWDVSFLEPEDGKSKTIQFTIVDSEENRSKLGALSSGQYCKIDDPNTPMSAYPVTNMKYTMQVTLREDEEFVRIKCIVENPTAKKAKGEAWLPMTYPVDENSKIIAPQHLRWRRDAWVFPEEANMIDFDRSEYVTPLAWPSSGIFYDFPYMEGGFHAVNLPSSDRGCAYVTNSDGGHHYMKLWSWGDKANFDRETANALAKGRPASEYYEPWGSGFNFAFFQTAEFPAYSVSSWESAILPIDGGMGDRPLNELRAHVASEIASKGVEVEPVQGPLSRSKLGSTLAKGL